MSTELVYRMRTCAAALAGNGNPSPVLLRDACDLLAEASNLLDVPEELGEPMEKLSIAEFSARLENPGGAVWGGDLPAVRAQLCPSCGDISARQVKRDGRKLMLTCPCCSSTWEYGKHG